MPRIESFWILYRIWRPFKSETNAATCGTLQANIPNKVNFWCKKVPNSSKVKGIPF